MKGTRPARAPEQALPSAMLSHSQQDQEQPTFHASDTEKDSLSMLRAQQVGPETNIN